MPFFAHAKDVVINGGKFHDVGGDWNEVDRSEHTHHEHSHNTNTTATSDSHNDSSMHNFIGMNAGQKKRSPPVDFRQTGVQNHKAVSAADLEALLKHALGRESRGLTNTRKEMVAHKSRRQTHNPFAQMQLPGQHISRQIIDPIPTSSDPNVTPSYRSNNPFQSRDEV